MCIRILRARFNAVGHSTRQGAYAVARLSQPGFDGSAGTVCLIDAADGEDSSALSVVNVVASCGASCRTCRVPFLVRLGVGRAARTSSNGLTLQKRASDGLSRWKLCKAVGGPGLAATHAVLDCEASARTASSRGRRQARLQQQLFMIEFAEGGRVRCPPCGSTKGTIPCACKALTLPNAAVG